MATRCRPPGFWGLRAPPCANASRNLKSNKVWRIFSKPPRRLHYCSEKLRLHASPVSPVHFAFRCLRRCSTAWSRFRQSMTSFAAYLLAPTTDCHCSVKLAPPEAGPFCSLKTDAELSGSVPAIYSCQFDAPSPSGSASEAEAGSEIVPKCSRRQLSEMPSLQLDALRSESVTKPFWTVAPAFYHARPLGDAEKINVDNAVLGRIRADA